MQARIVQSKLSPRFGVRCFAACALWVVVAPCAAMEVYINTNSPGKSSHGSQLLELDEWPQCAKAIDGIWYVGQGMSKTPEGKSAGKSREKWIEELKDKHWIVELKQSSAAKMSDATHEPHEVKALKSAGIKHFAAMVWDEEHNKDSTLSGAEVTAVREGLKAADIADSRLIVNTRAFHRNDLLHKLVEEKKVDGFSIEIPSHGVRKGKILEAEVATAINFGVHHQRDVYVLINAEHTSDLLGDLKDIFTTMLHHAGPALKSPHVKFVISSYSAGKTQFTPEHTSAGVHANTVTGAALWLCESAKKHDLRPGDHK